MQFEPGQFVEFVEDTGEVLVTTVIKDDGDLIQLKGRKGEFNTLRQRVFELGDDEGVAACLISMRSKFQNRIKEINCSLLAMNILAGMEPSSDSNN